MYTNTTGMKHKKEKTDFEISCPICGKINHYRASQDGELYCERCTELLVWFQYRITGIELKQLSESALHH